MIGHYLNEAYGWRGTLIATILLGVARVAAFIGVGVFSALIVAAIRDGRDTSALIAGLLIAAPLAALFHWLESWLAHAMAYQLLADMRVKLYDKLERLAPAYLLQRRSGDLVALATQDVEMVEYFYAHTIAPAIVSVLVPLSVLGFLGVYSWPVALALLPFLAYALVSPVRGRRRVDALGDKARAALGEMSAHTTDTIQGLADLTAFQATGRRRDQFLKVADHYRGRRLDILRDLSRQTAWFETAMGLGGLAVAVVGALQVQAHPTSQGQLATGIVFTTFSGMATATGIALTAIGCSNGTAASPGLCGGGLTTLGVGGAALWASIWLILDSRAHAEMRPGGGGRNFTVGPGFVGGRF